MLHADWATHSMVKEMNGEGDNGNVLIRAKCMGMTTIVNIRAAAL